MAAAIDFTNMLDDPDLHRHDLKLLADFLADGVFDLLKAASRFGRSKLRDLRSRKHWGNGFREVHQDAKATVYATVEETLGKL